MLNNYLHKGTTGESHELAKRVGVSKKRRLLSTIIDLTVLFVFSIGCWAAIENASGLLFSFSFIDEQSFRGNICILVTIYGILSFIYFLNSALNKGNTLGKRLTGLTFKNTSNSRLLKKKLIIREFLYKWLLFISILLLLVYFDFTIGVLVLAIIALTYTVASTILWGQQRKTLIDYISKTAIIRLEDNQSASCNYWVSISAALIDLSVVFCITTVTHYIFDNIYPFEYFDIFYIIVFFYLAIASIFNGHTIGRYLLGIKIESNKSTVKIWSTITRELIYKYFLTLAIPYILLYSLGINDPFCIFLDNIVIVGLIALVYFSRRGKMWWSTLSNTKKHLQKKSVINTTLTFLLLLIIWIGSYSFVRIQNNGYQESHLSLLGFEYPFKFKQYPTNERIDKYVDFIKTQHQSPKEYVLNLFKRYDIVILCENYHGESTQWELIYDIVNDKRFIDSVGNVFTEYGSIAHQDKINKYLTTKYDNDTIRAKNAAVLMWYMSGGFYNFIKELNVLNGKLPDSLKIREHFTDIIDWDYYVEGSRKDIPNINNRDSIMAQVIIDWYKNAQLTKKRKKCLVVTNYRHAFGYAGGVEAMKNNPKFLRLTSGNQGQYIFEAFPLYTANVLQVGQNCLSKTLFFPFRSSIQKGKWDKAFLLNKDQPLGFNLANTPFGQDNFDMYPLRGAKPMYKYQDFFTGLIFNKPYTQLKSVDYPFQRYARETEYRQKYDKVDPDELEYIYKYHNDNNGEPDVEQWKTSISLINFVELLTLIVFPFLGFITAIYHYIKSIFKKN